MDVLKIFNNGFKELVSVTPPDSKISSMSSIRDEDRGKAPGIPKANGMWTGYSWHNHDPSSSDIEHWLSFNLFIRLSNSVSRNMLEHLRNNLNSG